MRSTRRGVVRTGGVTVLALATGGCLLEGQSRGVSDVYVRNETTSERTVSILLTYADEGTAIDDSVTLAPDEETKYNNEVVRQTTVHVEVDVDGGTRDTYEWEDVGGSLTIVLSDDGVSFET